MKKIYVMGGGTLSHVRSGLAICSPDTGEDVPKLGTLCANKFREMNVDAILTSQADPWSMFGSQDDPIVTNKDVVDCLERLKADPDTAIIFFGMSLCDWSAQVAIDVELDIEPVQSGRCAEKLHTSGGRQVLYLTAADKVVSTIKQGREDILVVGFKTTCGASEYGQYLAGLSMLKENKLDLVLTNDTRTRTHIIVTPNDENYEIIKDHGVALEQLVDMVWYRSKSFQ